jgi:DNA primase small subunit
MFIKHIIPKSGHAILATEESWLALLQTLPQCAEPVRTNLEKQWNKAETTPAEKWDEVKRHIEIFLSKTKGGGKASKAMSSAESAKLESWPVETVFRYTYPRLDINVSKMQNHLLKSPFCVHPKTGRVCIPLQVDKIDSFDPFTVPTLPQLMDELDAFAKSHPDTKVAHEWEKTSLKESFQPFVKNFLDPMMSELRKKSRDAAEEQAAATGDF